MNEKTIAQQVTEYLLSLDNMISVAPVSVTIGKTTYHGARYQQTRISVKDQTEYIHEAIYLVGEVPAAYKRRKATCFVLTGETHEWFIASHISAAAAGNPEFSQFHPFGATFQIMAWDFSDPIDKYERYAYQRIPAVVQYL